MKIYTKTGDDGTTSVFGGRRLSKSDPQVEAYGTIDELSSFIGLLIEKVSPADKKFITDIQNKLYSIMSLLSGTPLKNTSLQEGVKTIEKRIDEIETKLPKLTQFILPQGGEISSLAHVARTISRRAEREAVKIKAPSEVLQYLNRLSDFFFVLARFYSKKEVLTRK